jgi:lipopolysaccharide export system permease protein
LIQPFSILNRYIFLEMLPPFFINMAFFTFIFLMKQILDITDMVVNHKVGVGPVFMMLVFMMPFFLRYVIPMSVMMAVLMTFLKLSGDNEIMAIKASGVSIYHLLKPVMAFCLLGTLATGAITIYGMPFGADRFRSLLLKVATSNLNVSLKERTFNDSFKGIMLYVNKIDTRNGELRNVFIQDNRTSGVNNTVVAKTGRLIGEPDKMVYYLRLFGGTINQMNFTEKSSNTIDFETYDIRLDLKDVIANGNVAHKRTDEMTLEEHIAYMHRVKGDRQEHASALIRYHQRFAFPFACIAMGLLAFPLGIQPRHSRKGLSIGLGLFFFLLYYILLAIGSTMGEDGNYPPVVAMWMPNLLLGGFGIYLIIRSGRERPVTLTWLDPYVDRIINWFRKK